MPSASMARHILGGHMTLDELFVNNRKEKQPGAFLASMRRRARYKIIEGFLSALDEKWRDSDNYVVRCGPELESLLRQMHDSLVQGRRTIRVTDLPPKYQALDPHWVDMVCGWATRRLLLEELTALRDGTPAKPKKRVNGVEIPASRGEKPLIWYHSGTRTWQACQSLMDQHDVLRREFYGHQPPTHARRLKRDQRSWHGRPREQRPRQRGLGIAPGASTGKAVPLHA